MPVDHQHNRIVFECDSCNETFDGEVGAEFTEAWTAAKREGWRAKQVAGEWLRGCPRCGV